MRGKGRRRSCAGWQGGFLPGTQPMDPSPAKRSRRKAEKFFVIPERPDEAWHKGRLSIDVAVRSGLLKPGSKACARFEMLLASHPAGVPLTDSAMGPSLDLPQHSFPQASRRSAAKWTRQQSTANTCASSAAMNDAQLDALTNMLVAELDPAQLELANNMPHDVLQYTVESTIAVLAAKQVSPTNGQLHQLVRRLSNIPAAAAPESPQPVPTKTLTRRISNTFSDILENTTVEIQLADSEPPQQQLQTGNGVPAPAAAAPPDPAEGARRGLKRTFSEAISEIMETVVETAAAPVRTLLRSISNKTAGLLGADPDTTRTTKSSDPTTTTTNKPFRRSTSNQEFAELLQSVFADQEDCEENAVVEGVASPRLRVQRSNLVPMPPSPTMPTAVSGPRSLSPDLQSKALLSHRITDTLYDLLSDPADEDEDEQQNAVLPFCRF